MSKASKHKRLAGSKPCFCGSGRDAGECCLFLIEGAAVAVSAEQLMRARYTAYVLSKVDYILSSWHSRRRPVTLELEKSLQSTQWLGLKVLSCSPVKDNTAYVEFVAAFSINGEAGQMHERSRFIFEHEQWFYVDGEQIEPTVQYHFKPPARNEPCHCGSGKKYKKCCATKI